MDDRPSPISELDRLRLSQAALERENERLRQELAAAGRVALRIQEARAAEDIGYAGRLAASQARTSEAELDASTAWARAADIGAALGRRIAEGQARLLASQAALASVERANQGLAAGRAALALREADLRAVIESAIDCAIVTTDRDGLVLAWNSGARRLLGWDEKGARAMHLGTILPPQARAAGMLAADIAAALAGTRVSREGWLQRQDGTAVWGGIEATALRADGVEEPVGVLWMLRDRTAAHQAEAALQEQERKYRTLFETLDEGVIIIERLPLRADGLRDWRYVALNPAARRMFGIGDLAGQSVRDHFPGEDEGWYDIYDRALDTGEVARFEREAASQGMVLQMYVARLDDRTSRRIMLVMQDVTARRRAEAALRESEERFRGFAENSADVLWMTSPDGRRLDYLSPAFERVFGEPRERILADLGRFRDLLHPDDRDAVAGYLPRALEGQSAIAHYRVIRPSDGRVVHLRDTGFPIRDDHGAVTRAAGIVQDISDLHATATALEAEKERFRTLAEGIPPPVWRAAPDGGWTWASPRWRAFTGQSAEQTLGQGWLDPVHPDDRDALRAAWAQAEARGVYQAEFRLREAASGSHVWFQIRGVPLRDAAGAIVEWIGACANIDEQVRARETLARNAEELERRVQERTGELMAAEESLRQSQKLEAIGQLTGGIAHDFNNMLQGVAGGLDMASRRMQAGRLEEAARYIDAARDATARAAGLTRRLLAFARRQRLEPQTLDPAALVRSMADMVRRTLGPAISLELLLGEGGGCVACDPNELESALLNLCINARDAMPQGGRLVVSTQRRALSAADLDGSPEVAPGDFVEIAVADTGLGMSPEVLEHVLEPFFTTKPLGEGTGLGLSQVYGFVRQSGGALRIGSTPGRGTTVHLWLPLAAPQAAGGTTPAEPDSAGAEVEGAVLLLVDDETGVREPAAARLRDLGLVVIEAQDGKGALRLLRDGLRPDLLVTDVGLPGGMDGARMAAAARHLVPGLPVLFMTGYATAPLPLDAEVIGKPFTLDALTARIRTLIAAATATQG
jgi:PAS domain S-box-containing protein